MFYQYWRSPKKEVLTRDHTWELVPENARRGFGQKKVQKEVRQQRKGKKVGQLHLHKLNTDHHYTLYST